MATIVAADEVSSELLPDHEPGAGPFDGRESGGLASYLDHPRLKAAKGWLDNLRRAVSSPAANHESDELERLRLEMLGLYEAGRYAEAEVEARRLVDRHTEAVGENHPDVATALSNLALLLQRQGDFKGAEALLRQTVTIRRQFFGEQHPDFAASLNNLALLHCETHDLDRAEPLLRQALAIRSQTLGEAHPEYATGLSSLALVLCGRREFHEAEPLLRQAVEIRRQALGEYHPDFATSLYNLALLLREQAQPHDAETLLHQALEIRRDALGPQHPETLSSQAALSAVLAQIGRSPTAELEDPHEDDGHSTHPVVPSEAKRELASSTDFSTDTDAPTSQPSTAAPRPCQVLLEEFAHLVHDFAAVSDGLLQQASLMEGSGLPPDLNVLAAASDCHGRFASLRAEASQRAVDLHLPITTDRDVARLDDLEALLHEIRDAEVEWCHQEQGRRQALDVLENVLAFRCQNADDQALLAECLEPARTLHATLSAASSAAIPPEVVSLADGDHPFAHLLALVLDQGAESEENWEAHYQATVAAFGKPLAVVAVRGRISAHSNDV